MRPLPTLLALTAAAAFGGLAATGLKLAFDSPAQAAPAAPAMLPAVAGSLPASVEGQALPSLAPMLKKTMPSVVSVYTTQRVQVRQRNPFADDPFFRRMFPQVP